MNSIPNLQELEKALDDIACDEWRTLCIQFKKSKNEMIFGTTQLYEGVFFINQKGMNDNPKLV